MSEVVVTLKLTVKDFDTVRDALMDAAYAAEKDRGDSDDPKLRSALTAKKATYDDLAGRLTR